MTTVITADSGGVSGTAGLKQSADSSGILALATGTGTTAVTIDTSQNVGIGTSSPGSKLEVQGRIAATTAGQSALFNGSTGTYASWQYNGTTVGDIGVGNNVFAGGGAGDFGVTSRSGNLVFGTGTTERARIDSSGNLYIGTTTAPTSFTARVNLAYAGSGYTWGVGPTNSTSAFYVATSTTTGVSMSTSATSWSSNSDERLKTALTPFENAAAKVATLRSGTGRYLTDPETTSRSFLIAQDVQAVLPEAVEVDEDEQQTLRLRYTDLIPLLTAAIQEQQALITQLQADVAALKGTK